MTNPDLTVTLSIWVPPEIDFVRVEAAEIAAADAERQAEEAEEDTAEAASPLIVPGVVVNEADAPAFFENAPNRLASYTELEGGVTISCGETRAGFADTFMWLGPKLCFEAVDGVLQHGSASFRLFSSATEVTLRRDGDMIEITADIMEPARFPADPLLTCLLAAGDRLIVLVERLWPDDSEAIDALPILRAQAAEIRARLKVATG